MKQPKQEEVEEMAMKYNIPLGDLESLLISQRKEVIEEIEVWAEKTDYWDESAGTATRRIIYLDDLLTQLNKLK